MFVRVEAEQVEPDQRNRQRQIGQFIRKQREAMGIDSQKELAELLGWSSRKISLYENGAFKMLLKDDVHDLARVFGIPAETWLDMYYDTRHESPGQKVPEERLIYTAKVSSIPWERVPEHVKRMIWSDLEEVDRLVKDSIEETE